MTLRAGDVILLILIAVAATVGHSMGLRSTAQPEVRTKTVVVVVAPCAEIDAAGYDGLQSCIDEHGELVRHR